MSAVWTWAGGDARRLDDPRADTVAAFPRATHLQHVSTYSAHRRTGQGHAAQRRGEAPIEKD